MSEEQEQYSSYGLFDVEKPPRRWSKPTVKEPIYAKRMSNDWLGGSSSSGMSVTSSPRRPSNSNDWFAAAAPKPPKQIKGCPSIKSNPFFGK